MPTWDVPSKFMRPIRSHGRRALARACLPLLAAWGLAVVDPLRAAVLELKPAAADCDEEFENVANKLRPGDELVLHEGVYSQACRRAVTVNGTPEKPIVIRAARGEHPVVARRGDDVDKQNNIEIVHSSYLVVRGVRFRGGSVGVRIMGGHHITIEDCEIDHTGAGGLTANFEDSHDLILRRNHIHHTGTSTAGPIEGEGMYLGCNDAKCRVSASLIEGNYIHHLRSTSEGGNDGIELKPGSYGNVIRDNVIHDTNIGTRFPCIFVYGGGPEVNVVEGNAVWNCGEAIQVVSDAIVRNNLVATSAEIGILARPHAQVPRVRNVQIVHNTVYGHPRCLVVRWADAAGVVLAHNALYCGGETAVDAEGLDRAAVTVAGNVVDGELRGARVDGIRFLAGGPAGAAFRDPQGLDFWPRPGSPLRGAARPPFVAEKDFNGRPRKSPADAGAYETGGLAENPGWRVKAGFKP